MNIEVLRRRMQACDSPNWEEWNRQIQNIVDSIPTKKEIFRLWPGRWNEYTWHRGTVVRIERCEGQEDGPNFSSDTEWPLVETVVQSVLDCFVLQGERWVPMFDGEQSCLRGTCEAAWECADVPLGTPVTIRGWHKRDNIAIVVEICHHDPDEFGNTWTAHGVHEPWSDHW